VIQPPMAAALFARAMARWMLVWVAVVVFMLVRAGILLTHGSLYWRIPVAAAIPSFFTYWVVKIGLMLREVFRLQSEEAVEKAKERENERLIKAAEAVKARQLLASEFASHLRDVLEHPPEEGPSE